MNPLYACLYAHVMVLFWPWLWWQLRAIERWRQATGRGLLIATDQYGNVHVRWVEDAPDAAHVRAPVSVRLARALSGDEPFSQFIRSPRRKPGLRRDQQSHCDCPAAGPSASAGLANLPLPHT
jgi:hypothetical protein